MYFDFEDYLPAKQIIDREIDLYRMDWSNLDGNNQKIIETFYPLEDGNSTRRIVETLAFDSSLRHTKDIIFLVNDLNQIGGVHTFVHNMAKYYKEKYNSRIYLLAIKEFAEHNSEFHVFDSPSVDFKISSQYLKGGCANILQNTDGICYFSAIFCSFAFSAISLRCQIYPNVPWGCERYDFRRAICSPLRVAE